MKDVQKAKTFSTGFFYQQIKVVVDCFGDTQKARKSGDIDKAFYEKIMLAVSQVNGCRMCSYLHTKNAIDAGASEEEINAMTSGELGDLDHDESLALMFAQHYADSNGKYDPQTFKKVEDHYGVEKARYILATIKAIMVGNIHGIAMDGFKSRLKGKKVEGSKLRNEMGILFGIVVLIPAAIVETWFRRIFRKREKLQVLVQS